MDTYIVQGVIKQVIEGEAMSATKAITHGKAAGFREFWLNK